MRYLVYERGICQGYRAAMEAGPVWETDDYAAAVEDVETSADEWGLMSFIVDSATGQVVDPVRW